MPGVVANALNPSTWKTGEADLCEFKANFFYRVSSRKAEQLQRNAVSNIPPPQRECSLIA